MECLQVYTIFRCTLCGKAFKSGNNLMIHKRNTHKIIGPNAKREEGTGRVETWRVWKQKTLPKKKKKTRKKKVVEGSK